MKSVLHAVAVMRIEVQIGDAREPLIEPGQHQQHRVVEVAEPGRPVAPAMMRAAAGAMHHATATGQPGRQHRAPRRGRRSPPDFSVHRIAPRPDVVAGAILIAHRLRRLRPLERTQVAAIMEPRDFVHAGDRRGHELGVVQPAHRAAEIGAGGDARDRQRMPRPVGRAAIHLAADIHRAQARIGQREFCLHAAPIARPLAR
jgi:hypothetical protein